MKSDEAGPAKGVEAVDRALSILATFEAGHERQSLSQIAQRTGFYKSTILRLCQSLERFGYIFREEAGTYVLGAEPLRLAAVARRSSNLERQVRPVLKALLADTGESTSFFRRHGNRRICLYREDTHHAIRDHVMEGDVLPLNVGAAGHVLVAFEDRDLAPKKLAERYAKMPQASFGERDPETAAVAAPVFGFDGLAGALALSGPRTRLTPERVAEIGEVLLGHAEALSKLLGGTVPSRREKAAA